MISHLKIGNSYKNFQSLLRNIMVKSNKTNIMLTSLAVSAGMIITSLACGGIAYGAEAPAGDENFNYNGYSATQLKNISECISGVIPASQCPSYEASSKDYYTGIANHANMPTGVISTKTGWLQWADAAMKANSYDGVYGTLKIAPGGATGTTSSPTDVRFRLIGINQDNRADGSGKAGLTFQAAGSYHINSSMNTTGNAGGWRDSQLRKNLNDNKSDTIWNAIQSTDFKNNIIPVLKTTNNNAYISKCRYDGCTYSDYNSTNTSNASSITTDKLWILSPSEMGMPVIKNYKVIHNWGLYQSDANVHYYDSDSYKNTIKSSGDNTNPDNIKFWRAAYNYLYANDSYQWWMLPAGSRKMSNNNQAYHNTDSYSYCALINATTPSTNKTCFDYLYNYSYWLRSFDDCHCNRFAVGLGDNDAEWYIGVVIAFSF